MYEPRIISNADLWAAIERCDPWRAEILAWLTGNDIEISDVPVRSAIVLEAGPDGTPVIRHTVHLRNVTGHWYLADPNDPEKGAAIEERTVPMKVPPPANWRPALVRPPTPSP